MFMLIIQKIMHSWIKQMFVLYEDRTRDKSRAVSLALGPQPLLYPCSQIISLRTFTVSEDFRSNKTTWSLICFRLVSLAIMKGWWPETIEGFDELVNKIKNNSDKTCRLGLSFW